MKKSKLVLWLLVILLAPRLATALLVGPYTPDANTVVLLHLDEAAGGSVTTNVGTLGKNFYCVNYSSDSTPLSLVTTMMGAPSYSTNSPTTINFNNCESNGTAGYELGFDYNGDGMFEPDTGGGTSVDFLPMAVLGMGNGGQSPFTLEALIQPTSTAGNQEIICTDSDASNRGFQFRITSGSLQFQFITGSQAVSTAIPTTGPDAFVPGAWYHVAIVYNGTTATLYWTRMDPSVGAAHVLGTPATLALGTSDGSVTGPLVIGNRGRPTGSETFLGAIDEVRISNVARAANQMQFYSPFVTITQNPISQNVDYNQPVTFTVGASSQTPLGYQWLLDSNSIAGDTNSSLVFTNATAGNAGYYSVVVTNTAGYAATSSPALLIVGAANFLSHRYSFSNILTSIAVTNTLDLDSIGGATGTNWGEATVSGGKLVLNGTTNTYMQLPGGLFNSTNATALTVEFWATYGVNPNNVYVFSIGYTNFIIGSGIVGVNYAIFSPHNASGQGLSISPSDSSFAQSTTAAGTLDGATWHVVCVMDPPDKTLAIYTNGVLEAVNTNLTVNLANVNDQLSYIGASLFAVDPYLNASIDELRLYNGALSSLSILQSDAQGPNSILTSGPAQFEVQPTNTTAVAGQAATFAALATGYLPISYQWFKNGTQVPGATNTTYTFVVATGDNNDAIVCEATNTIGVTTYVTNSATATLTVRTPLNLTWAGIGPNWDLTSQNWTNTANNALTVYTDGDNPTFSSSGVAQSTVNLTQALHPSAVTVTGASYEFDGVGSIAGTAVLSRSGTGTLILDTTNSYSGPTTNSGGGVLQLGDGITTGSIGTNAVVNDGALVAMPGGSAAVAVPGPISGSGNFALNSVSGAAYLSGSNSFTGGTTVTAGSLHAENSSALGNGSTLVNAGGQVYVDVNVNLNPLPMMLNGTGVTNDGALRKGGAGATSYGGTITLGSDSTLWVDSSATLNLTNSSGLNGISANANLSLNGSGAGNIAGPLSLGSGGLNVNGGTWTVAPTNFFTGLVAVNGGTLRVTGTQSFGQVVSFNPSQVTLNGGDLDAATNLDLDDGNIGITLNASSTVAADTNATLIISNQITDGSGYNLTKTGPGTVVLAGPSSLNGNLYVDTAQTSTGNDGTLVIANNAAIQDLLALAGTPTIQVNDENGATSTLGLEGGVTVPQDVSLNGRNNAVPTIDNLGGTNTISGNITLGVGGGTYTFQADGGILTLSALLPYATPTNSTRTLTFAGAAVVIVPGGIGNGSSTGVSNIWINVIQNGPGVLSLPAANTYSGTTTVSNGVLELNGGVIGNGAVTVVGGLLVGNGTITGPVTVQSGAAIEAGATNVIGTLTLGNTLTLYGNTIVKINKTMASSDLFTNQSSVTYGGTLTVTNLAGTLAQGNSFTLFSPGASTSNFNNIVGTPGPGLGYSFTNGVLSIIQAIANNPTNITFKVSGNVLNLSWPANHLGWTLQGQTNSAGVGLTTNWVNVPNSASVTSTNITINPSNGSVFFRLMNSQ